jgi:hypothetical protein
MKELSHSETRANRPSTAPIRQSPRAARSRARHIGFSLFALMMTLILLFVLWLAT